jgi:hypothetical protein
MRYVVQNMDIRKIFGPTRDEARNKENYTKRNLIICIAYLLFRSRDSSVAGLRAE